MFSYVLWLSVRLQPKWLRVRVPLHNLKKGIFCALAIRTMSAYLPYSTPVIQQEIFLVLSSKDE